MPVLRGGRRWVIAAAVVASVFAAAAGCSIATSFAGLTGDATSADARGDAVVRADGTTTNESGDNESGAPPTILRFTVTDCSTGDDIKMLNDGDTLSRAMLPSTFSVRVYTDPALVGSVSFKVDDVLVNVEANPPYDLAGGSSTLPDPWVVADGSHTIEAKAFSSGDASGTEGPPELIHVTVTE